MLNAIVWNGVAIRARKGLKNGLPTGAGTHSTTSAFDAFWLSGRQLEGTWSLLPGFNSHKEKSSIAQKNLLSVAIQSLSPRVGFSSVCQYVTRDMAEAHNGADVIGA